MFPLHVALSGEEPPLSSGAQLCAHRMAGCVLPLASCSANHILLYAILVKWIPLSETLTVSIYNDYIETQSWLQRLSESHLGIIASKALFLSPQPRSPAAARSKKSKQPNSPSEPFGTTQTDICTVQTRILFRTNGPNSKWGLCMVLRKFLMYRSIPRPAPLPFNRCVSRYFLFWVGLAGLSSLSHGGVFPFLQSVAMPLWWDCGGLSSCCRGGTGPLAGLESPYWPKAPCNHISRDLVGPKHQSRPEPPTQQPHALQTFRRVCAAPKARKFGPIPNFSMAFSATAAPIHHSVEENAILGPRVHKPAAARKQPTFCSLTAKHQLFGAHWVTGQGRCPRHCPGGPWHRPSSPPMSHHRRRSSSSSSSSSSSRRKMKVVIVVEIILLLCPMK